MKATLLSVSQYINWINDLGEGSVYVEPVLKDQP